MLKATRGAIVGRSNKRKRLAFSFFTAALEYTSTTTAIGADVYIADDGVIKGDNYWCFLL